MYRYVEGDKGERGVIWKLEEIILEGVGSVGEFLF